MKLLIDSKLRGNTNLEKAFNFFLAQNTEDGSLFTPEQSAGICGNFFVESGGSKTGLDKLAAGKIVAAGDIDPEANNKSRVEVGSGAVKIINQDNSGNSSTVLSFDSTGDVVSDNFLLERTRLFGAGGDGDIILLSNSASVATGSGAEGSGIS